MQLLKTKESRILLLLLVLSISAHWLLPEAGYKRELRAKDKYYRHRIDSIQALRKRQADSTEHYKTIASQERVMRLVAEEDRDIARQQSQKQQQKYENILRNMPRYTPVGMDSAVAARYGWTR